MIILIPFILVFLYNMILIIGTAYLVTVWNWNPYWFIATFLLLGRTK